MYNPRQRMVVSVTNASGDPDFFFVIIDNIPEDQYDLGQHYSAAISVATSEGYDYDCIAYDEYDIVRTGLEKLFVWESASVIKFDDAIKM